MFYEEGGNLGNLCIWKVCIKLIGDQDVESWGRGQPPPFVEEKCKKSYMEEVEEEEREEAFLILLKKKNVKMPKLRILLGALPNQYMVKGGEGSISWRGGGRRRK